MFSVRFIIFLTDKQNNASFIYHSNTKSRRVVISVQGAGNVELSDACDSPIVIQHYVQKILRKKLKIEILTDSETLFNMIIIIASTTEQRLMIDIKAAREA